MNASNVCEMFENIGSKNVMLAGLDTMDVVFSNLYNLDFPYLLCQNRKYLFKSFNLK